MPKRLKNGKQRPLIFRLSSYENTRGDSASASDSKCVYVFVCVCLVSILQKFAYIFILANKKIVYLYLYLLHFVHLISFIFLFSKFKTIE